MRIVFLMQDTRMGGIEYNSLHLAEGLRGKAVEIHFWVPGEGKLTTMLHQKQMEIRKYCRLPFYSTSTKIFGRYFFNPVTTLYNFLTFPVVAVQLAGRLRSGNYQLIFTKGLLANFYGALAARLAGIPCVWDMQEVVSRKKCFGLMSWILDRWAFFFTRAVVVSSQAIASQFSEAVQKRVVVIPNGIDTDIFHPGVDRKAVRREWGIRDDEILVGHIARFTYWKGQKEFVLAASRLVLKIPQICFVVVGAPVFDNDVYEREVRELANVPALSGRIQFAGFRDDLAEVMAALDIFVHSSIEAEGCPLTLLTAMAMGKPVVASRVEGNDEIIDNGQGILVRPVPEAIANALEKLITDPDEAKRCSVRARARILERYSLGSYASECAKVFEKNAR